MFFLFSSGIQCKIKVKFYTTQNSDEGILLQQEDKTHCINGLGFLTA
jgi:hypothetical protein